MTQLATECQFTAKINGKGVTPSGTPYLQFDWKLPGSQFPFQLLLGREPETYEAWNVGQLAWVSLVRGGLKTGKTGEYSTDYFWNLTSIGDGDESDITPPASIPSQSPPEPISGGLQPVEGVVRGHVENIAVNLFKQVFGDLDEIADGHLEFIRELRDRVYHQLTSKPITPPHYCYEHEKPRIQSKTGAWGHREEDGFCVEGVPGITVAVAPAQPTQPEPPPPEEPEEEFPF